MRTFVFCDHAKDRLCPGREGRSVLILQFDLQKNRIHLKLFVREMFLSKFYQEIFPDVSVFGGARAKNSGVSLYVQQFRGMFVKRVIHSWRNRVLTISQILVPIIFTIFACLPVKTISSKFLLRLVRIV